MATDAGIGALWALGSFPGIVDYDSWEAELLEDEDITRHITAGALVPVNIRSDGAFQVIARIGEAAHLTERELKHLVVSSEPYLLVTTTDAVISGLEHVGAEVDEGVRLQLPPGRWSVTICMLDCEEEPDFTILITPEDQPDRKYRTNVQTFDR